MFWGRGQMKAFPLGGRSHEVTDEGSSRATVPLPSPSSPPSAELPPQGEAFGAGGFLCSLTSPRWSSCAASSKCSCKQAFLLASGGMAVGAGATGRGASDGMTDEGGMKAFPLGVSRALFASPRCGVRARRTEVFAIVGKNRDRWRRRSLRRRDRCHEVTDEGASGATVSLPSPSSPPSAAPRGKPFLTSSRMPLFPALPVNVPQKRSTFLWEPYSGGCRAKRGGRVVKVGVARAKQPFRLAFGNPPPLAQGRRGGGGAFCCVITRQHCVLSEIVGRGRGRRGKGVGKCALRSKIMTVR